MGSPEERSCERNDYEMDNTVKMNTYKFKDSLVYMSNRIIPLFVFWCARWSVPRNWRNFLYQPLLIWLNDGLPDTSGNLCDYRTCGLYDSQKVSRRHLLKCVMKHLVDGRKKLRQCFAYALLYMTLLATRASMHPNTTRGRKFAFASKSGLHTRSPKMSLKCM